MQPSDREKFVGVLNGLAAVKPGKPLTPEAINVWWMAMRDWTIEQFTAAASHLAGSVEFMPNPYHFQQLRQAGQPTPGEAWLAVLSGEPLSPGSRIARAAQMVGGQRHVRHADREKDLPHLQRRFLELYADLCEVEPVREALPAITLPSEQRTLIGTALKTLPR